MSPETKNGRKNPLLEALVKEGRKILDNPESLYDLAGKRLALRSIQLRDHFLQPENTFRIAIVGSPNGGKTTISYSLYQIYQSYNFPASYFDLDLYTQSGLAISGSIPWEKRLKREEVPREEVMQSIQTFGNNGTGIVVGDFPGRIDNPYQTQRLEKADLAIILARSMREKEKWAKLCLKANVGYRWLVSKLLPSYEAPIYPQVAGLNRKVAFNPLTLTLATSILEEAAELTNAPDQSYEEFFTQPELMVLQEYLDFLFSVQNT